MKRKIKVYTTSFGENDFSLLANLRRYGFGRTEWKNLEFTAENDFDVVAVLTAPWKEYWDFNENKAVRFLTEPPTSTHHKHVADVVCPLCLAFPSWINHKERTLIGAYPNK